MFLNVCQKTEQFWLKSEKKIEFFSWEKKKKPTHTKIFHGGNKKTNKILTSSSDPCLALWKSLLPVSSKQNDRSSCNVPDISSTFHFYCCLVYLVYCEVCGRWREWVVGVFAAWDHYCQCSSGSEKKKKKSNQDALASSISNSSLWNKEKELL